MIRGTTPKLTLRIKNGGELDLTAATEVYVTVWKGGKTVTKSGDELTVEPQAVSFTLSQAESISFAEGTAAVQINWIYTDAETMEKRRAATKVKEIQINRQLLVKVV